MNVRTGLILGLSAGVHGLLLWLVAAPPRPPVLLLPYGDMGVDVSAGDGLGASVKPAGRNPPGEVRPAAETAVRSARVVGRQPRSAPRETELPRQPRVVTGQSEKGEAVPKVKTPPRERGNEEPKPAPATKTEKKAPPARAETVPAEREHVLLAAARPARNPELAAAGEGSAVKPSAASVAEPGAGQRTGPASGSGSRGAVPGGTGGGTRGVPNGVRYVSSRMLEYPEEARLAGQEGTVLVWVRIARGGRVTEARAQKSSGSPLLDEEALEWARSLQFVAADGGAVTAETVGLLPVGFHLR